MWNLNVDCHAAAVPPFLALYYATIARGPSLAWLCRICLVLSFLAGITAVLLMWVLYPIHYDYATALKETNSFYNAQRVGALPADNNIPWRSNALLYETGKPQHRLSIKTQLPKPHWAQVLHRYYPVCIVAWRKHAI